MGKGLYTHDMSKEPSEARGAWCPGTGFTDPRVDAGSQTQSLQEQYILFLTAEPFL